MRWRESGQRLDSFISVILDGQIVVRGTVSPRGLCWLRGSQGSPREGKRPRMPGEGWFTSGFSPVSPCSDRNSHQSAWSSAAALCGRQAAGNVSPANRQGNRGSARRRNLLAGRSSLVPPCAWQPKPRPSPHTDQPGWKRQLPECYSERGRNRKWGRRRGLVSAASAAGGDWFRYAGRLLAWGVAAEGPASGCRLVWPCGRSLGNARSPCGPKLLMLFLPAFRRCRSLWAMRGLFRGTLELGVRVF